MNDVSSSSQHFTRRLVAAAAVLVAVVFTAPKAEAQVPARFYWHTLSGANAVPLIVNSMSGNTNPFDPAHMILPEGEVEATLTIAGYARTFTLFDRSAMAAALLPMGRITGGATLAGQSFDAAARGFGDPTFELAVNLVGPKAQKSLVDVVRYEPGFSLDVIADLAVPIGEYDNSQALNLGQNRWYGRLGAPVVWQFGAWVPGRRTTLELLPAVWVFGSNDDYQGRTLETDPMFQIDAHLTRDFTEHLWGSLDGSWYTGGQATVDGVEGEKLDNLGVGLSFGYQLNPNLALTFGYKSTIGDGAPGDLQMDGFMISLVSGWHAIVEGARRLQGGE